MTPKLPSLNVAGRLAAAFVQSKLTALFVLMLVGIGAVLYVVMPRDENPQIVVPAIEITVSLPGATAQEVEQQLVRPLESMVRPVSGIEHVYATALPSMAIVNVQFHPGENKQKALLAVNDRVFGHRNELPAEAGMPQVRSIEVEDVPIVTVTLASAAHDDYELKRLADRIVDGLRSLDSVSVLGVRGGRDRELRVEIDPARLQTFGMPLDQVRSALAQANVAMPLGEVVRNGRQHEAWVQDVVGDAASLRQLAVGTYRNRLIHLGDVARVVDGPTDEPQTLSRLSYGPAHVDAAGRAVPLGELPAVTLYVAKKPGTNAVAVAADVLARVERLKAQLVPGDVDVVVTRDDGRRAEAAVNKLFEHFGIAVLAVALVCALFLGIREALIVVATVPLILVITLGACYLFGLTINRVTLFAVILALGLLVDAAIVVIENIHRKFSEGGTRSMHEVAVDAVNEIAQPTNLATLAVMLVFGCLLPLPGMLGQFFQPIGFGVCVAMAASLLVAYVVVPWAATRWLRPHDGRGHASQGQQDRLRQRYRSALGALLTSPRRRRWLFIALAVSLSLSLLQPAWQFIRPAGPGGPASWGGVLLSLLVKDNKNTFAIVLQLPPGATLQDTDRLAREVGTLLRSYPQVRHYLTWVGQAGVSDFTSIATGDDRLRGPGIVEIRVNLIDKARRDLTSVALVQALRPQVQRLAAKMPGTIVQLREDAVGPAMRATLLAEIYGEDPAQRRELSAQVAKAFQSTYDLAEVVRSDTAEAWQEQIVVDREKAALTGVSVAQVATTLRRLMAGEVLGQAHLPGEKNPVPIRLKVPQRWQIDPARLGGITITSAQGRAVPLAELLRVQTVPKEQPLLRKDGVPVSYVSGELASTPWLPAQLDLDRRLDGLALPGGRSLSTGNLGPTPVVPDIAEGPRLLWDGEPRLMLSTYRDMLWTIAGVVVGILLMLIAYYRAFDLPLVAMAALPLALIGVFPGHWLMGINFTSSSMIGVIALAGVVVRNSLLIIDFALEYLRQGMPVEEALVEAGAVRLRPIVLTALAIVLGSAIMLKDPVFQGLAASLISGTVVSTVLTVLVVPVLLLPVLRRRDLQGKLVS